MDGAYCIGFILMIFAEAWYGCQMANGGLGRLVLRGFTQLLPLVKGSRARMVWGITHVWHMVMRCWGT